MKIITKKLAPLSLLVLMVSCANPYKDGLKDGQAMGRQQGYNEGYDAGVKKGDEDGYARAKAYFESAGFNEGFSDGKKIGLGEGYKQGYTVGKNETYKPNYDRGYNNGYDDGHEDGEDRGYDEGYSDGHQEVLDRAYDRGYDVGYFDGKDDGYDLGYDDGYDTGYDLGYDDGFGDASLSVGKSKELRGYANIISLAHNTLIDYSKISKPRSTRKGILANGRLLFSETSLTNKDTLKRKAAVEQYLVIEMAKQVKGKFKLSDERSLKIAKAANHFRKQSSSRALTSEDTDAYATEIIGSDFSVIQAAYQQTLRGDGAAFTEVLDRAAEKNETSPEQISQIITKYFM